MGFVGLWCVDVMERRTKMFENHCSKNTVRTLALQHKENQI